MAEYEHGKNLIAFQLEETLEPTGHWLPSQRIIKEFIHHNTLHAVDNFLFHKSVAVATKIFSAHGHVPISDYQCMYKDARMQH